MTGTPVGSRTERSHYCSEKQRFLLKFKLSERWPYEQGPIGNLYDSQTFQLFQLKVHTTLAMVTSSGRCLRKSFTTFEWSFSAAKCNGDWPCWKQVKKNITRHVNQINLSHIIWQTRIGPCYYVRFPLPRTPVLGPVRADHGPVRGQGSSAMESGATSLAYTKNGHTPV